MTTQQPEALRLADIVERLNVGVHSQAIAEEYSAAARELRRLHSENEALKQEIAATQPAAHGMDTRDLLAEIEREYIELADIHNNWHGRATAHGQAKLCRLRDLISKHTGREPRDVQDDYGMRAALAAQAKQDK